MTTKKPRNICPVEVAGVLDNSLRKLVQNPQKILKPYIKEGMVVLDLGCGPGFFTLEIAKLLSNSGKVIAADLQDEMLGKVRQKIKNTELEQRITLHKCSEGQINLSKKVDFVLAFYMVHEVPDQEKLFKELKVLLKSNGQLFIIEPKVHVSKKGFDNMIEKIKAIGFEIDNTPGVFFSRTAILRNRE